MSVIGSLRISFLNILEVIHFASLPIHPNSQASNTVRILLELYSVFGDDSGLGQK